MSTLWCCGWAVGVAKTFFIFSFQNLSTRVYLGSSLQAFQGGLVLGHRYASDHGCQKMTRRYPTIKRQSMLPSIFNKLLCEVWTATSPLWSFDCLFDGVVCDDQAPMASMVAGRDAICIFFAPWCNFGEGNGKQYKRKLHFCGIFILGPKVPEALFILFMQHEGLEFALFFWYFCAAFSWGDKLHSPPLMMAADK